MNELYPSDPVLLIHAYLTRTRKGKEFFTKFFENREKNLNIKGEKKVHLDSIKSNKLKYKEVKNLFIDILCKAKFSRLEIINSLNIKLSNDKFHRIKNRIPLLAQGKTPIDKIKLTKEIKEWEEKIMNDNIIRKTV